MIRMCLTLLRKFPMYLFSVAVKFLLFSFVTYSVLCSTFERISTRYDLMIACKDIGEGKLHVPEMLGDVRIKEITTDGAYQTKLDSKRVTNQRIVELLQRYTKRQSTFDTEFSSELAPDSNNAESSSTEVAL